MKLLKYLFLLIPTLLLSKPYMTELRVGYFYPNSQTMRDIYHKGGIEYELEQSVYINQDWIAWGNINYFKLNGHAINCNEKTSISELPLSVGVKYNFYQGRNFDFYLGIGGSYTFLRLHDHSSYVKQKATKNALGIVAKSGLTYFISRQVFLDVYMDYYYSRVSGVKNSENKIVYPKAQDIGGLRTGLGLGIVY